MIIFAFLSTGTEKNFATATNAAAPDILLKPGVHVVKLYSGAYPNVIITLASAFPAIPISPQPKH